MNTEIFGIVITFLVTFLSAYPLGKYMARVFRGEKVWTDFLIPVEKLIFRFAGIDPKRSMDWKENLRAMLLLNLIFFL
ncbi:MAG: potassium-transporting ATPase subunit KdpA, partial [Syntrophothermus sp.]